MDKGKYVSRATYQKVVEENKRLKADLRAITFDDNDDALVEAHTRWYAHFKLEDDFNRNLIEMLTHAKKQQS